jgi:hypothetical protein
MKKQCANCQQVFSLCDCDAPNWDLTWSSFEITDGTVRVLWDEGSQRLVGDHSLEWLLRGRLDGSAAEIALPGCYLELRESNPYAVQYVATVIYGLQVSDTGPDFRDLIENIPGRIY